MPNDTAPAATGRAQVGDNLWAIRADTYAQIVAAVEAGDTAALHEPEPQAAVRSPVRGSGGAVAVIPVQGVIRPKPSLLAMLFGMGGGSIAQIRSMLRDATADSSVGAIVLDVDSPGGMIDGVPELGEEIRQARSKKPIVAVANARAASAAYWIASQATELFVTPSGAVGSIGVFVAHEDWSGFDARLGIKTTMVSAGKFKTEGNPFEPLSDEAREAIQATVDEYYGMFVSAVAKGRKVPEAKVRGGFGEGRMVLASAAVDEGMADRVGTIEDAVSRAAELSAGARTGARADGDGLTVTAEDLHDAVAAAVDSRLAQLDSAPQPAAAGAPDPEDVPDADEADGFDQLATSLAAGSQTYRAALRSRQDQ